MRLVGEEGKLLAPHGAGGRLSSKVAPRFPGGADQDIGTSLPQWASSPHPQGLLGKLWPH